jgi:hypothetical protein
MWVTTEILPRIAVIALMIIACALAEPASALVGAVPAGAVAPPPEASQAPPPPEASPQITSYLYSSPLAAGRGRWKTEFRDGSSLLQRGEYSVNGLSLLAEMGDIKISETANTVDGISGRGGRFALSAANGGSAVRLQTFASSRAGSGPEGMLAGASGEISFLADTARFKTVLVTGREALGQGLKPSQLGERRGDVLGLMAAIEPFKGRLAAEAELDFSIFDRDTADDVGAVRDSALRLQLLGELGSYRYKALYEKTGPDYRLLGTKGPKRDSEGVSLGVQSSQGVHDLDLKLSRYHNNTERRENQARIYRYEGLLDYTLKAIDDLPLGLRYKKTLVDSEREPAGYEPKRTEEDAVAGKVNYLTGKWNLGLLASYSQRTDLIRDEREATSTTFSFLPKFAAAGLTLAPDFSLQRTLDLVASQRTDRYAVGLGINGSALEKKLDYQLNGGFRREWAATTGYRKETVGANLQAAYPSLSLFKRNWQPSLGITGEYNGIVNPAAARRENAFSFLFSLEGKSLL